MNIYIAKDHVGNVYGLCVAKSKEVAQAFFTGKYGAYYTMEEIDLLELNFNVVPVYNIIETKEQRVYSSKDWNAKEKDIRTIVPR